MIKTLDDSGLEIILNTIIEEIRSFSNTIKGNTGMLLGLSGGIDSALVAALAVMALGNRKVFGVLMPSRFSSSHSIDDALSLAHNLDIKTAIIPITNTYDTFRDEIIDGIEKSDLEDSIKNKVDIFDTAYENMQARIRGTTLMTLSNKYNYILLNTSNRSESAMGYSTMHGDMCGALAVIGDLYKTDIFALSNYINKKNGSILIPKNSIEKPPSAELREDQKDIDSLPDYDMLDSILELYLEKKLSPDDISKQYSKVTVEWIIKQYNATAYKRAYAPKPIKLRDIIASF